MKGVKGRSMGRAYKCEVGKLLLLFPLMTLLLTQHIPCSISYFTFSIPYFTFSIPYFTLGGTTDRTAVRETQRHSYLYQSRHRDSSMASLWTDFWLFNSARHPTANVTHRHSYLHKTHSRDMVTAILQAAQQLWRTVTCDAPSQLISLVLVTASLALLGSEIPSRQAILIPKRKMLLVSLGRLAHRAFAISLSPSRQVRNGSTYR